MKKFQDILIIDATAFDVEKWDKLDLFHNYDRMRSYVSANSGAECFDFFARPKTGHKKNEIIWQSDLFDTTPVQLSSLSGNEYKRYKAVLDEKMKKLKAFVEKIEQRSETSGWAQLIGKAMLYGGDDYVFCGEGKIAIAAWSMKPAKQHVHNPAGLEFDEKSNHDEEHDVSPPVVPPPVDNSQAGGSNTDNANNGQNTVPPPYVPPPVDNSQSGGDNTGNAGSGQNVPPPVVPPAARKKCPWWKWLLYILAALLLAALLFGLLRNCSAPAVLPPMPGVLPPIDSGDIGYDDDSISQVVTNRLNILLESPDIEGFARDFKKAYPDSKYRIIYYDTVIRRLQLQIPKDEKNKIRDELPQKLPQYSFFIYDESIFEGSYRPNDPGMNDAAKSWYLDAIKAPQAWDITRGDPEITIAIIDDGFDLSHPELKKRVYLPYNAVSRNSDIFYHYKSSTNGIFDHGTHVSGTATGEADNRAGLLGIAPNCRYMPVQVGNQNGIMTTTAVMDATLYAIYHKADVINLSLGMIFSPSIKYLPEYIQRTMAENNFLEETKVWNKIYKIAERHNATIVFACGNDNILTGIDPKQRSDYCIHVAAVNTKLGKAYFSNWGEQANISAPGVEIYSSVSNNRYKFFQGTSMAAPIVTGAVALIKSIDRNMSSRDILRLLQNTGKPVASSKKTGNLIQLDRALAAIGSSTTPNVDCRNIARKIDSLTQVIERLKRQCPQYASPDTMKLPGIIDNPAKLNGRWKSTTDIYNIHSEKVSIYFDFNNRRGKLQFVENNGKTCYAPVRVNIAGNTLEIVQEDYAGCEDGSKYVKYTFSCKADRNGNAACVATSVDNKLNKVNFKLIKTR
jgi:subtilisin family serine protease